MEIPKIDDRELERQIELCLELGCMTSLKQIDLISYIYMCYKQHYYLGEPIVSDPEFDRFEEIIKEHWPSNPVLNVVGLIYPKCRCC